MRVGGRGVYACVSGEFSFFFLIECIDSLLPFRSSLVLSTSLLAALALLMMVVMLE